MNNQSFNKKIINDIAELNQLVNELLLTMDVQQLKSWITPHLNKRHFASLALNSTRDKDMAKEALISFSSIDELIKLEPSAFFIQTVIPKYSVYRSHLFNFDAHLSMMAFELESVNHSTSINVCNKYHANESIDDVNQEGFFIIRKCLSHIRSNSSINEVAGYILRTLYLDKADFLKKQIEHNITHDELVYDNEPQVSSNPETALLSSSIEDEVQSLFDNLKPMHQIIFLNDAGLLDKQYDIAEIASIFSCSKSLVSHNKHQLNSQLESLLVA
ncbi:hypothetical protein L0B53_19010 (plasmid) [Vibrio sp. SS-MA-C1-2]|uniref:hypothetical protein n=1 Tax=Vibrio sp. SS-MA-C1-2 TaxID=2908646 RepID=UPI001F20321A|nr:hypothetical protein [Vibrio sp. SS-MA-C1-2]UJF20227.1 hypothetical protein L0B53_19010 [Vibrio sp. SS-MA-C1-2]